MSRGRSDKKSETVDGSVRLVEFDRVCSNVSNAVSTASVPNSWIEPAPQLLRSGANTPDIKLLVTENPMSCVCGICSRAMVPDIRTTSLRVLHSTAEIARDVNDGID